MTDVIKTKEVIKNTLSDIEILERELERAKVALLPAVTDYLKAVRGIRMGFAEEIRQIMRDSQHLSTLTKSLPVLKEVAVSIHMIREVLTPDMVGKLERLFGPPVLDEDMRRALEEEDKVRRENE